MRPLSFASIFFLATNAQLLPILNAQPGVARTPPSLILQQQQQQPMADAHDTPGIQLPPPTSEDKNPDSGGSKSNDNNDPSSAPAPGSDSVILSDVLSTQRSINLFAGFTRDISGVSARLASGGVNTTVLAPINGAITGLPRKPWEDARDYAAWGAEAAYAGTEGEDRAHRNLRRFVEAHVVPASPWEEGRKVESLAGGVLWWERRGPEGTAFVMPGEVEVERVVSRVANGEVWAVKGVVNYAA